MIKIHGQTGQTQDFPKFMKNKVTGAIVLFIEEGVGILLQLGDASSYKYLGMLDDKWQTNSFEDYNEPITLVNGG